MTNHSRPPRYLLEAIARDSGFFNRLLDVVRTHPESPLIFLGLVPIASMFVIESHARLLPIFPELGRLLSEDDLSLIRPSRHRAKLLLTDRSELSAVAAEIARIAVAQREEFLKPHTGALAWLKRWVQPDMGVFTYDGHIFSSTHAVIFGFGSDTHLRTRGHEIGSLLGRFISTLARAVPLSVPSNPSYHPAGGMVEMKDIKFEALYCRGALGTLSLGFAAACALILATINLTHRVIRDLVDPAEYTFFKLKFLSAYHAQLSIQRIQDTLRPTGRLASGAARVFGEILQHLDARWLRRRGDLRNFLVHFQPHQLGRFAAESSCDDVTAQLLGERHLPDVDQLLDRYLRNLADRLSDGFLLNRNAFWYGRVTTRNRVG